MLHLLLYIYIYSKFYYFYCKYTICVKAAN